MEFERLPDTGYWSDRGPNVFDEVAIWDHFLDLCEKVGVECKKHYACAQAATQTGNWVVAYSEWTSCKDVIVRSESLLDKESWLWFLGFHALVWANLCAFYSMNFRLALTAAIAAFKARVELRNVSKALDFKSYVLPTLWMVMYLWASTADCEEEALEADVKAFLIDLLGHPRNSLSDSDLSTLKEQCKEIVINQFEFVEWHIGKHYLDYGNMEELLRWSRECSKTYRKMFGQVDYMSKYSEAVMLMLSMFWEDASKILAEIKDYMDSKPWEAIRSQVKIGRRFDPEFADDVNGLLCVCYQKLSQPGERNFEERKTFSELAEQAENGHHSPQEPLPVSELEKIYSTMNNGKVQAEMRDHVENNKFEEAEACYQKFIETYPGKKVAASEISKIFYEHFKTKYRQSYESGCPDESHFSNAKSWAMKCLKVDHYSNVKMQPLTFMKLVNLYHEKDRELLFLKQSSNIRPLINDDETAPILQYGRKVIEGFVKVLIQHTNQNDSWILLQSFYKHLYYMLQFHNFASWIGSRGCTVDSKSNITFRGRLEQLWNQSLLPERASVESAVTEEIWKQSLLWAERQCAKNTHLQLATKMLSTSVREQLGEFDLEDDLAWSTLKSSRAACGPKTVFLEYFFSEENDLQFVYIMTKEDEVFMQILKTEETMTTILGNVLEFLRKIFSQWSITPEEEKKQGNGMLEWMYEMLISPVANFLDDMEQEDKLIIVAPEMLSDVPFAALRKPNSPVGEGYLIQSHTISVTPSLRILQHCNQRLKELNQAVPLHRKLGTIVAVGDPAYKERRQRYGQATGDAEVSRRLQASGEEVNFIEDLFGKEYVKKLVGPEATPSEVLKWAKYPSENGVKQVVLHIAAHGIGQDGHDVKKGAIVLALPGSSCQQNYDTAGQGAMPRAEDDENFDYDNVQDETELGDLFSMVDVKEEAQISSHGEVGGIRTEIVVPISKHAPDILKSENISACGFQWETHMVVLSACDTARGQITAEGVLNLPRALMIVGVPCVVVSQWKVGDSSTCELIKGFYGELRSGKDVSSSLRAAMLKMIKDEVKVGGKVHEWAPFFVCGLPTVCLPTELQAGTSCKGYDRGTSSDTKAERRFKNVKVKALDDIDPTQRFIDLALRIK